MSPAPQPGPGPSPQPPTPQPPQPSPSPQPAPSGPWVGFARTTTANVWGPGRYAIASLRNLTAGLRSGQRYAVTCRFKAETSRPLSRLWYYVPYGLKGYHGGAAGILLSYLIGLGFNALASEFAMSFSTWSIVSAVCCSTFIGVLFGFMPAKNASKLNPIAALSRD